MTPVASGSFLSKGDRFEAISATPQVRQLLQQVYDAFDIPGASSETFREFLNVVQQASEGKLNDQQAEDATRAIHPAFIRFLPIFRRFGWANAISLLSLVITIYGCWSDAAYQKDMADRIAHLEAGSDASLDVQREMLREMKKANETRYRSEGSLPPRSQSPISNRLASPEHSANRKSRRRAQAADRRKQR